MPDPTPLEGMAERVAARVLSRPCHKCGRRVADGVGPGCSYCNGYGGTGVTISLPTHQIEAVLQALTPSDCAELAVARGGMEVAGYECRPGIVGAAECYKPFSVAALGEHEDRPLYRKSELEGALQTVIDLDALYEGGDPIVADLAERARQALSPTAGEGE